MSNDRKKRQRFTRWVSRAITAKNLVIMTLEREAGLSGGCLQHALEREAAMHPATIRALLPVVEKASGMKYGRDT